MRQTTLPRTVWSIDGYQVEVGQDWSCTELANVGFDQFRGHISPRSAHDLPWTVGLGSIVTGRTEDGTVIWEGSISAPLQIEADDWVRVAAQGYVHESSKIADRVSILVTAPEAWVIGNTSPLNFPQSGTQQPTIDYTNVNDGMNGKESITNRVELSGTLTNNMSIAFWARGARIMRFSYLQSNNGNGDPGGIAIYGARGPDIYGTRALLYVGPNNTQEGVDIDVNADQEYDAIVVEWLFTTASSNTRFLSHPRIYSDHRSSSPKAKDVFAAIGRHMGWDTSGVQNIGEAVFPTFDWASTAIGALSEAAGPDDLMFQVRERLGGLEGEPKLELREWGERLWTASAATGAAWSLERMERYSRVTASYLDVLGQVRSVSLDADPDPLNGRAVKELLVTLGGLVPVDTTENLASVLAQKVLDSVASQRWRGDITVPILYGEGGRQATYEIRAGDTIRLSDWSQLDGALEDRIAAVGKSEGGVTITLEPAVFAGRGLSGGASITPGTLLPPTNLPSYKPPAAPGTTTPSTGIPDDVLWPGEFIGQSGGGFGYGGIVVVGGGFKPHK